MSKLTANDLRKIFYGVRDDHPGRRGKVTAKGNTGHTPRFRKTKHERRYGTKHVRDILRRR